MNFSSVLGILAGILTTVSFIPQLVQVVKTKSTKDISLPMFIIFSLGVLCWLVYGILTEAVPIIIANSMVLVFATIILGFKLKYK